MGNHIDTRNQQRRKVKEHDEAARHRRASFKQYLRQIEEDLLEIDEDLMETEDEDDLPTS
jgi:hypothetical protein